MEINNLSKHKLNCRDCEECIAGYPTLCSCGGLIHAEYGVLEEKGRFVNTGPHLRCDKCGLKFMRSNHKLRRKGRANYNNRHNKSNEFKGRSNSSF
jgi:hypothetical protein